MAGTNDAPLLINQQLYGDGTRERDGGGGLGFKEKDNGDRTRCN
jgi:hypothetical protein